MTEYLVPTGFGEAELTEKRSRFIGRVWPVENEEEALSKIRETREKHWDARHNVYAYIIRENGIMRYSDDGEPQGTSGLPVLGVFRGEEVVNFCCVVTRYFGGVLLGTGGLVRAYSHTAKLALEAAGISLMRMWKRAEMTLPYSVFERIKLEIPVFGGVIDDINYGAEVDIKSFIPDSEIDAFVSRITDITAGGVIPQVTGEEFRGAPVK